MNSLKTLYYPSAAVNSLRLCPIFLLFQNIHFLAPVENSTPSGDHGFTDSFIKSGFCQVLTPQPLGEDRNRFLRLVADIKNRKDDYAGQLSSLTLAAMTDIPGHAQETERSIALSLLSGKVVQPEEKKKAVREKLWQARLVMAIGELLDQEEEEIALDLASLENEEKALFRELQGEDDSVDEEHFLSSISRLDGVSRFGSAGTTQKRFAAWQTLFLAGEMNDYATFLTRGQANRDIVLEAFERRTGQAPLPIANLRLPAVVDWDSDVARKRVLGFAAEHSALLAIFEKHFLQSLDEIATPDQSEEITNRLSPAVLAWEELVNTTFPEEKCGRISVACHLLPGHPCSTLVGKERNPENPAQNGLLVAME